MTYVHDSNSEAREEMWTTDDRVRHSLSFPQDSISPIKIKDEDIVREIFLATKQ
jgi:hypothetical protein